MTDTSLVAAAKARLQEKRAEADGIASAFKVDSDGNFEMSTKQYGDYKSAVDEAKEAKSFIDAVEAHGKLAEYLDTPEGKSVAAGDAAGSQAGLEMKSLADVFMGSEEFKAAQGKGDHFKSVARIHGEFEGKSLHALSGGTHTLSALGTPQNVGFTERAMRKTRIRDLFPKSTTKAPVLYGVVETGWVNNAQQVRQRYAADGAYGLANDQTDRTYTNGAFTTISPSCVRTHMLKSSDCRTGEPEMRVIVSPCARLIVQRWLRTTSSVTGSSASSTSSWNASRGDTRERQSGAGT